MGRVAGLQYNGSVFRHLGGNGPDNFGRASGVYAVLPQYMEDLNGQERVKVGFAGTKYADSQSGSIAKRMGDYSTCFVNFFVPALVFYQGAARKGSDYQAELSHNDANKAEREMKAWLKKNGHTPIVHISGMRESEWYEITLDVLKQLFDWLIDMNQPGLLGPKPEPSGAWWFGSEKIMVDKTTFDKGQIERYNVWEPIVSGRDTRERRDLEKQLREAETAQREGKTKPRDRFRIRDLRAQLSAMLNPGLVRVEDEDIKAVNEFADNTETKIEQNNDLPIVPNEMTLSVLEDDPSMSVFDIFAGGDDEAPFFASAPSGRSKPSRIIGKRFHNTRSSVRQLRSATQRPRRF